jgi:uncharacterized protein YlbG (UPF0298 family)
MKFERWVCLTANINVGALGRKCFYIICFRKDLNVKDFKFPKSNKIINKNELSILKQYKTGILNMNSKVGKLDFEAIRIFNIVNAFQAIIYTHEKEQFTSNKHIHGMLSCNTNKIEEIVNEISSSHRYLKQIRNGYDSVLCKTLKNSSIKDKAFKDTLNRVPYWELKGNDFLYYIAPIVQEVNMYTYINKFQKNPYNNLNYIIK